MQDMIDRRSLAEQAPESFQANAGEFTPRARQLLAANVGESVFDALKQLRSEAAVTRAGERARYMPALRATDWAALLAAAQERLASASDGLAALLDLSRQLGAIQADVITLHAEAAANFKALKKRRGWKAVRAALIQSRQGKLTPEEVRLATAAIDSGALILPGGVLKTVAAQARKLVDRRVDALVRALVLAELARAVASFNQRLQRQDSAPLQLAVLQLEPGAAGLAEAWRAVYEVLKSGELEGLPAALESLSQAAEVAQEEALLVAAVVRDWRLGDVLRGTLVARAACLLLQSMAAPAGRQGLPRWAAAAARLPFSAAADGTGVLGVAEFRRQLADASGAIPGPLVQVEGRLDKLLIVHLQQKPVSVGLLTDGNGHSLAVVLPHIKLDSGGAVPGAMVRVAGVYAADALTRHLPTFPPAQAAELEKMPREGLLVDRLNLSARARLSWLDWVAREGAAWFTPVPHALNVSWSWEGGLDGAANQIRYATW